MELAIGKCQNVIKRNLRDADLHDEDVNIVEIEVINFVMNLKMSQ
jgi:hypothetical protein